MTEHLKIIARLARRAREDTAPPVDVSAQVLRRLRARQQSSYRPLLVFTMVSVAAAALALIYSIGLFEAMTDPLWTMFQVLPVAG